ncbi:hypothetical protein GCM10020367_18070 [Streptomyces sannanensis]|uniref:Chemotaxis protein n=1 Tax=Streptomyces sannanensis TaxID=285536 RepID=A0ABP6S8G4_9ACTN
MRHTFELTPAVLAALRAPRPYPAISLLMPTHRQAAQDTQSAITLRNMIAGAKKQLADDPGLAREKRMDVEKQLDAAAAEVDLRNAAKTTLVLAAPGEHEVWALPTETAERVVIAGTFLTRDLVSSWLHEQPYWALVISEDRSRLWHGAGDTLEEVTAFGFPARPEIPDHQDAQPGANFGDYGGSHHMHHDERVRQYLRAVDGKLADAVRSNPAPVHLVGLEMTLKAFEALSRNTEHLGARVARGGSDKATGHELAEILHPAREEYAARREQEALDRLNKAPGQRRFAAGLDEVWRAAHESRIELLLVEESFEATAVPTGTHLAPAESPEVPGAEEDVVDTLVETTLGTGAEVMFVGDGRLEAHGRVAAVLRY